MSELSSAVVSVSSSGVNGGVLRVIVRSPCGGDGVIFFCASDAGWADRRRGLHIRAPTKGPVGSKHCNQPICTPSNL